MMKFLFVLCCLLQFCDSFSQTVTQKLQKAFQQFENDGQLKYAISSLYVIDAKTGKVVFDKNSQIGLAPASTQKVVTSVTAYELLGKDFTYKTNFVLSKDLHLGNLYLFVQGSGDPTFGSSRFRSTSPSLIFDNIYRSLQNSAPQTLFVLDFMFGTASLPEGYIWQDIGNYYGSGHYQLNWKENQYDIVFESGKEKITSKVIKINMDTTGMTFFNEVISGSPESGDNAYIYAAPYSKNIYLRGTIPPNKKSFEISGAVPDPPLSFAKELKADLESRWKNIISEKKVNAYVTGRSTNELIGMPVFGSFDTVYKYSSPPLDSIIYWFNKKSINLYGEALIKTVAYEKNGFGSTDSGVAIVKKFWKQKGIDEAELNISDGSGLSPQNRVTTHAQVEILKYARTRDWFSSFYNSLPEYNGMKIKSGTIKDVKGFCGYHKAKDGKEYIFSFLVNNYNGSSSALVNKMYKVLDVLK